MNVLNTFSRAALTSKNILQPMVLKLSARTLVSRRMNHIKAEDAREFTIQLPIGQVAGKEWGNLNGHPVLCLHGSMDNCNAFKPMAPYLSPDHHYIAPDAISHGKSDHFPIGTSINFYDFVVHLRRIVQHLKLSKFSIVGQSMGATVGLMYGSFYPEELERLLLLDIIKPAPIPLPFHTQKTGKAIDLTLSLEKKIYEGTPKSYTMEDLVSRYVKATQGTISAKSVRVLMERGAKVVGDGYGYAHDARMGMPLVIRYKAEDHRVIVKDNLKCHLKVVKGTKGAYYDPPELMEEFKSYYRQQCKSFEYVEVDGYHHFHMDQPELTATYVNEFLQPLTASADEKN